MFCKWAEESEMRNPKAIIKAERGYRSLYRRSRIEVADCFRVK